MKYNHNDTFEHNGIKFIAIDITDTQHKYGVCTGCHFDRSSGDGFYKCNMKDDELSVFGRCYKDGKSMIFMSSQNIEK